MGAWADAQALRLSPAVVDAKEVSLFAVAAVGYVWFYWYWNVLGFQY